ncbi:MAG: 3-keto-5-aminohexanoate cleavage protein [Hyphomicrobiaceae bacterium]
MNWDVFITCAITGAGATTDKSDKVPVTPEQIANSAIEAAKAGAAVVHLHVRDPKTGRGSRSVALYKEAVDRIRSSGIDVVVNLTAGMGGDLVLGGTEKPLPVKANGTDMAGAEERLAHVTELLPEICTLDCGTMNFLAGGDYIMVNSVDMLRAMAKRIQQLGVKPECEVFDTGHLWQVKDLMKEGLLDDPVLIQLCMGIPYGAPSEVNTLMSMVNTMPAGAVWSSFAISRMQMPWVAQSVLAGGNVRIGLEDNIYLSKGVLASNGQLVDRAVTILSAMNVNILKPADVRKKLKLQKRG